MIEAGPDYVGLTEIAELLGISRQAMRKIMATNIEAFPLPVHEGNPSIWHLKNKLARHVLKNSSRMNFADEPARRWCVSGLTTGFCLLQPVFRVVSRVLRTPNLASRPFRG